MSNLYKSWDNLLYTTVKIKLSELLGAVIAFIFLFILMSSYMIVKPVRDAMASDFADFELAKLWTYTFFASTLAVCVYNLLASWLSLRVLVPLVFGFFSVTFFATAGAIYTSMFDAAILGKVFYVWVSVFSLFNISVFWSFISQHYSKEQSKRVFGFINLGASVGAILGPLAVKLFVKEWPLELILLVTTVMVGSVVPIVIFLNRYFRNSNPSGTNKNQQLSANPFSGVKAFFSEKRLIGISLFIFIFAGISSFFYIAQKDILVEFSREDRREILSDLDLYINTLTILLSMFATNRIATKFGLSTALAIVPVIVALSLVLFATVPTVTMFLVLQCLRKAGNYSITRPAREILYTAVDKEARFKSKPFVDVAVYRGADLFWIWFLAALGGEGLGLSLPQRLLVGAFIALGWAGVGYFLGKSHEKYEQLPPKLEAD